MTAWYADRTFYACVCGARDEVKGEEPPETLPCWRDCGGTMQQWTPPAVKIERNEIGGKAK